MKYRLYYLYYCFKAKLLFPVRTPKSFVRAARILCKILARAKVTNTKPVRSGDPVDSLEFSFIAYALCCVAEHGVEWVLRPEMIRGIYVDARTQWEDEHRNTML